MWFSIFLLSSFAKAENQRCNDKPENIDLLKVTGESICRNLSPFQTLLQADPGLGFVLKTDNNIKVDLVTKVKLPKYFSPTIDFAGVRQHFESLGYKVLYMVVGPYHDRSYNIEGLTVDNGDQVGYSSLFPNHSALVSIVNGQMSLYHLPTKSNQEIKNLIKRTETDKGDLFQQHFAVHKGLATNTRHNQPEYERDREYTMRFLAEFNDGSQGVIQIDRPMNWKEAMDVLKRVKVKNAVYLDMGALAHGVLIDSNGQAWITGSGLPSKSLNEYKANSRSYTNLLVFYTNKDRTP